MAASPRAPVSVVADRVANRLLGMIPVRMTFAGSYRFATAEDLDAAIAGVEELLDGEDEAFVPDLELRRRGLELRVRVDAECPRDWYLAYETLIEALAATAVEGEVDGEIGDTITSYPATRPQARMSAPAWWLPLVACSSELAGALA